MVAVPWSYASSWRCTGCGICCKRYEVVLKFIEWLRLVQNFGVEVTSSNLGKLYLGKRPNGLCIFLTGSRRVCFCGLQNIKPLACKLWPFKILDKPKYGRQKEAVFDYKERRFYIYIDTFCPEITWGKPTDRLVYNLIPEFIEIALGLREKQFYSTAMSLYDLYSEPKRKYRLI